MSLNRRCVMLWVCWEQGIRSVSSYCTATAQHSVCTADRATAPLPSLWWAARHGLLIGPIGGQHVVLCAVAKFLVIWPATSLQTSSARMLVPALGSVDDFRRAKASTTGLEPVGCLR